MTRPQPKSLQFHEIEKRVSTGYRTLLSSLFGCMFTWLTEKMEDLYDADGRFFGQLEQNGLCWRQDGHFVGKFIGTELYESRGQYIAEIYEGRLVTDSAKLGKRVVPFDQESDRFSISSRSDLNAIYCPYGFQNYRGVDRNAEQVSSKLAELVRDRYSSFFPRSSHSVARRS